MTVDQQIQIWNAAGTWIAGLATFAAVVVSLYLANRSNKVHLKVYAGLRVIFAGDGSPPEEHLNISVTNLGDRPVTINSVGWAIGKGKKKQLCIQTVSGRYTNQYPIELAHGKEANFKVSFLNTPNWAKDFMDGFTKTPTDKHLKTLDVLVYTSVGQIIKAKPEKGLLELLKNVHQNG